AFVESTIEVCDSSIGGVERGLNEVGGSFLPDFRWCPWTTRILAELPTPNDAARHSMHVSAADFTELALAPESLTMAFAPGLQPQDRVISITLRDSAGGQSMALPLLVSAGSVTYLLPGGVAPGPVQVGITTNAGQQYVDSLYVQVFAPSL